MIYQTYGVVIGSDGEKNRFFTGSFDNIEAAKHRANCATLGNAEYAYVKDTHGDVVFSIAAPAGYKEQPIQHPQQ